jgi:hypothetical protein
MMGFLDIFPSAMNRLKISPAQTARPVSDTVTLAPKRSWGIQMTIIVFKVSIKIRFIDIYTG